MESKQLIIWPGGVRTDPKWICFYWNHIFTGSTEIFCVCDNNSISNNTILNAVAYLKDIALFAVPGSKPPLVYWLGLTTIPLNLWIIVKKLKSLSKVVIMWPQVLPVHSRSTSQHKYVHIWLMKGTNIQSTGPVFLQRSLPYLMTLQKTTHIVHVQHISTFDSVNSQTVAMLPHVTFRYFVFLVWI